jgi:transposase
MPKRPRRDPKLDALRAQGTLHPRPQDVADPLFQDHGFFDPCDLVQVKYEMVRRVEGEGQSITKAAAAFGLSRPSFYQAQAALHREGLAGLLPRKRGPRGAHKITAEVVTFVAQAMAQDARLQPAELADIVAQRFGVKVHPRSIERAIERRQEKKQP